MLKYDCLNTNLYTNPKTVIWIWHYMWQLLLLIIIHVGCSSQGFIDTWESVLHVLPGLTL